MTFEKSGRWQVKYKMETDIGWKTARNRTLNRLDFNFESALMRARELEMEGYYVALRRLEGDLFVFEL